MFPGIPSPIPSLDGMAPHDSNAFSFFPLEFWNNYVDLLEGPIQIDTGLLNDESEVDRIGVLEDDEDDDEDDLSTIAPPIPRVGTISDEDDWEREDLTEDSTDYSSIGSLELIMVHGSGTTEDPYDLTVDYMPIGMLRETPDRSDWGDDLDNLPDLDDFYEC